jgi:hypothetical protein
MPPPASRLLGDTMPPLPKRQHYVPQMLLEEFTDTEGWLHWCRLDADDTTVRPARPLELFQKKHLYSIISGTGEKNPGIELQLSRLESDTRPVIRRIVENVRTGRVPELTPAEKHIWYNFFLMQWRRTPEAQQSAASDEDMRAMFDETVAELRSAFPARRAEIDALDTPANRARSIRNARAESVLESGESVIEVLERRGISVLRVTNPGKSFIVGSRPVVKLSVAGQSDLSNPIVEMWLPVASDVAVGVGDATGLITLYPVDQHGVRRLNVATAMQSGVIAGRSPQLVRSIAARR